MFSASPTPEEVVDISSIADTGLRNLRITECYYRLSVAMAERTGACANWCTFATWASRQAGRTIRGEDLFAQLSDHSRPGWTFMHPVRSLWRKLLRIGIFNPGTAAGRVVQAIHSPFDAFERASTAVAEGNLRVFEEIGFEFARYLRECAAGSSGNSRGFEMFLSGLRSGPPPEGQELLRRAFSFYHQQASEADGVKRAQLIFLANLNIGLHEQTRLQPQIQAALEVVPVTAADLTRRLSQVLSPGSRLVAFCLRPLAYVATRYRRFARELTRRAITESLMVLEFPDLRLSLGRHLEAPCPEPLLNLTESDLLDFLAPYEPQGSACDNCGAEDWADIAQRMHYIVHLFRAFHLHPALNTNPFTEAQWNRVQLGEIPDGVL